MESLTANRVLWAITALLALAASPIGVANPAIYDHVVSAEIRPGVLSQDIVIITGSLLVLALVARVRADSATGPLVILGVMGFYFYAYGIYTIERLYNPLYLVYMAVLGLSLYAIVCGVASLSTTALQRVALPRWVRYAAIAFLLLVTVVFNILWIGALLPLMRTGDKIEFFYSVYILDLCFIMPAFAISAVLAARRLGLGLVTVPALCVFGFGLIESLALGDAPRPLWALPFNGTQFALDVALALAFLALAVASLRGLCIATDAT